MTEITQKLLQAVSFHVAFDGWSDASFDAAVEEAGVDPVVARGLFPRGAVDLAMAYHRQGDQMMVTRMLSEDLSQMRFSERVAFGVRARLEAVDDREAVRRGTTLFALPQYAGDGAKLIWGTCDAIWNTLGDTSRDFNWYTKRATLSAVYSATVLYWLGDDSEGQADTWAFLERRIENVMQFEKFKAKTKSGPLGRLMAGPLWMLEGVRAPEPAQDLPGGVGQTRD